MPASQRWNLSILQLLLLTALCGLLAGLVASSRQQSGWNGHQRLAFSPDGRYLAACSVRGQLCVWDLEPPQPVARRSSPAPDSMYNPIFSFIDPTTVVLVHTVESGNWKPELLLCDIVRDREFRRVSLPHTGPSLYAVSADGLLAIHPLGGRASEIILCGARDGVKRRTLLNVHTGCSFLGFSADGSKLVSLGAEPNADTVVQIWDTARGDKRTLNLPCPCPSFAGWMALSPDAERLALYGQADAGRIEVWDLGTGKRVMESLPGGGFMGGLEFAPDGRSIVDWGWGRMRILDATTGKAPAWATMEGGGLSSIAVAFSPDSRSLAVVYNRAVSLWDAACLERRLDLHRDNRVLIGGMYSAALLAWAALWGWIARRRSEQSLEGSREEACQRGQLQYVQAGLHPWQNGLKFLLSGLLLGVVLAAAFTDRMTRLVYLSYAARFTLLVLLTVLGLVLLTLALVWLRPVYRRWRGLPHRDAIRRAAGIAEPAGCRVVTLGPATAADLGDSQLAAKFAARSAEPADEPLQAELLDEDGTSSEASGSSVPHPVGPITAGQLQLVWTLLVLGGLSAILWGVAVSLADASWSLVPSVLSILAGVYAITRRTGGRLRGLRAAALGLMSTLLLGNIIAALLGLLTLAQLRNKS